VWEGSHSLQTQAGAEAATNMKQRRFPPGWDEARVQRVLAHYETQTEAEAVAEDTAAFDTRDQARASVPRERAAAARESTAKYGK
jgi:hypothetical protein